MLKKLTIFLSSTVMLSAGVAYATTMPQPSISGNSALLAQTVSCVTDVDEFPSANDQVVYVTQDTACFEETNAIVIDDESYDIEYEDETGYYYVVYNNVPWYLVNWNGITLLTNGNDYVAIDSFQ